MSEKFSIEIDSDFAKSFFALSDKQVPEDIELENLNEVLKIIKLKLETAASLQNVKQNNLNSNGDNSLENANNSSVRLKSVLVVDDLGIITIQLENLFKKLGFAVTVSRELFDAIEQYKTQDFGYAIVDLFIPTEREGFILIDEIKKLSLLCKLDTKIIVMSASNKKEHKEKCLNRGANDYIEKIQGWQKKIMEACIEDEEVLNSGNQ